MLIQNKTKVPNKIILEYFNFVKPPELKKEIQILRIRKYTKHNHISGLTSQGMFEARIMIKMCFRSELYPYKYLFSEETHKLGYMDFKSYSPEETLVYLLGHEVYHVRQYELGRTKDKDCEFQACIYGLTKLQEYRDLNKKGFYLPKIGY